MNTTMRLRAAGLAVLAALVLMACDGGQGRLASGMPAPAFELSHLSGTTVQFPGDYRGKVVAIRFWADWCPYCKDEMQDIEPVYRKYRDAGLLVLAINVMQPAETAQAFMQKLDVSYDVLLDRQGDVARNYGVLGLPTTYFIDREGTVRAKIHGESTAEVFERIVKELL
ncbi:MAG: TlpA disulfide reductase family protein [Gammaproteobacteria bacterium]